MILNVCENRKDTGMILINHMFLIDTLHQKTLLDITKCMGFSDKTKQFYSYFAEDDVFSEAGTINCGVPEGSISRPSWFLLYVNDITPPLTNSDAYLNAYDTSIFIHIRTLRKLNIF